MPPGQQILISTLRQLIGEWAFVSGQGRYYHLMSSSSAVRHCSLVISLILIFLLLRAVALPAHGDVERNPGPSTSASGTPLSGSLSHLNSNRHHSGRSAATGTAPGFELHVSVLHLNARSLYPKLSDLSNVVSTLRPDVIAVTETWLTGSVPDGVLRLPEYSQLVRVDRKLFQRHQAESTTAHDTAKQCGGVALYYLSSKTPSSSLFDLTYALGVWVELRPSCPILSQPLVIGCLYQSPSSSPTAFADSLETSLNLLDLGRTNLLLVGDFNAKSPSWNPSDSFNQAGQILEHEFLHLGLHQCVTLAAHLLPDGGLGSTLDLVLVSDSSWLDNVSTHPPLGSSDHLAVLCKVHFPMRRSGTSGRPGQMIWCSDKADFTAVNHALKAADWSSVSDATDVDSAWTAWQKVFLSVVDKFIPSKTVKHLKRKNPLVTSQI